MDKLEDFQPIFKRIIENSSKNEKLNDEKNAIFKETDRIIEEYCERNK